MDTLKTIQTLSKIGEVLSKIIFVVSIVAACLSVVGIVSLALGADSFQLGDVTIQGLIDNNTGLSNAALYTVMAVVAVASVAEAVLAKFAELYFKHELADGGPFTLRGARELFRLGILTIAIPAGTMLLCSIGINIVDNYFPGADTLFGGEYTQVGLGVMMILGSLLCRYGAERSIES